MSLTLQGLPAEITADHKFVIVSNDFAADQARRLLPAQVVLWPPDDVPLEELPMDAWLPLQGADVLLWPTNTESDKVTMVQVANRLQRVTDSVRMVYVNGADPDGFSAEHMSSWDTKQLVEWAKSRIQPYVKPDSPPSSMDSLYAESAPPFPFDREPGSDDEPEVEIAETEPVIAEETDKPERRRIKWSELEGKTPPDRNWIISHWLTHGPTLLAGQGGIGKTLLAQMLGTAVALGRPYIDQIAEPANVLFWACEDDHDELWRRQLAICNHFGVNLSDLENKLIIEPRLGMENSLLLPTFGAPTWTALRQEMRQQVNDYKASVLIVDNIGQCFGGNENDRHHVTAFLSGLVGLSESPLAVLMLGHPAKSTNSEYSGSTAWENAVRMRWYLGTRLPDKKQPEEEEPDTSIRFLCKRKTNYSQLDYRQLTYQNGAYQCDTPDTGATFKEKYGSPHRKDHADALVLAAIDQFFRAGVRVTEGPSSPDHILKKMKEIQVCQDYTQRELTEALTRLRLSGRVVNAPVGQYDNRAKKMGLAPLGLI